MNNGLSRREFLHRVGILGGSASVYRAAHILGLVPAVGRADRPEIQALSSGKRRRVIILGAGISGLVAAYELSRKGYDVQVLEASHRAGGRNLTLRAGDRIDEVGSPQTCRFDRDPDLYFNAGPARIPGDHTALLGYCRELGVQLAPFINENRNAWVQDDAMLGGRPIRNREYIGDTRGFIAELLAKSLKPEQLLAPFTAVDYDRVMTYVREFGDLDKQLRYRGQWRAGPLIANCATASQRRQPLDAAELLRSEFMKWMSFTEESNEAAMMMEPVGGMDRIVAGFLANIAPLVKTQCPVEAIQLLEGGVAVAYRHEGARHVVHADYCLNCIPMQLLPNIDHNFPREYADAFSAIPSVRGFKIAFQMKQRFWEQEGIYGGISWTMQDILQIWYPAHGIHRDKGIVIGAYVWENEPFAALPPSERLKLAISQGEKVHPNYGSYVENGVSVVWHRMRHMVGNCADWSADSCSRWFSRLQEPVGRHYLIGDQVSQSVGWQEGAIHSAFHAIADIDRRVHAEDAQRTL